MQIVPHNPVWPARFQTIKAALPAALPQNAISHHIGSTAVPGLAAKGIIDIQVTLPHLTDLDAGALAAAGFMPLLPDRDPMPPGLSLPDHAVAKRLFRSHDPAAAIHIRAPGRSNQRHPLQCRNYLRTPPWPPPPMRPSNTASLPERCLGLQ